MYRLSHAFLVLSAFAGFVLLVPLWITGWPWSNAMALAMVIVIGYHASRRQLTTLGSARWADNRDLQYAGMLDCNSGLILGRVMAGGHSLLEPLRLLFWARLEPQEICERFWRLFQRGHRHVVRASQAIHTAVFAPSGQGKGVSCIVPFLLECDESCVVVDFKGENARLTAAHRRNVLGHEVVLLDPFHVVTDQPDTFNPLDGILPTHHLAIDDCNDLAKALVVRNPEEKEPHWNDSAEAWIAAMLATVVRYGDQDGTRSLQTMRDLFSSPERTEMAIQAMCESDAWEGMLARMGGQLRHFVDREKSSTLSTVSRHLRFLDTPAVAASTVSSSFDPSKLLSGKMTIYLILPPEHMRAQSGLLRLWIGSLLRTIVRAGLRTSGNTHFILDEAASLGNLQAIDDAVDKYRGYGIRLQFYYQSLGQLKKCFPDGQDQTLLSNTTQVFFAVNDTATAELVSTRLGEETIVVQSGGTGSGSSSQQSWGMQPQERSSYSTNRSHNWQQRARKLLKPEEVIALSPRQAITFTPGVPPICTTLLRYYEEPSIGHRPGRIERLLTASKVLAMSLLLCSTILMFTVALFHQMAMTARVP